MTLKKRLARVVRAWTRDVNSGFKPSSPGFADVGYAYLGPDRALVRLRNGHWLYVDPQDDSMSAQLIVHRYWESAVYDVVMRLLSPSDKVIEVGANLGYYTVAMASRVGADGSITAFEANPRLARMVAQSASINGLSPRVDIIPKAAMDHHGTVDFVTSRKMSGGGYVSIWDHTAYDDAVVLNVEAIPLDSLNPSGVDFIRMDAEGSEPFILRGAEQILRANPDVRICMEWSVLQMASRTSVPAFLAWLSELGFKFWKIEIDSSLSAISPRDLETTESCDVVLARNLPGSLLTHRNPS